MVQLEKGTKGIIFDIYGGGYLFGNHMDENHFCHYLHEKTGLSVVSCYYDLSSKSKYPTQIEQVYQTIKMIQPFMRNTRIKSVICELRLFVQGRVVRCNSRDNGSDHGDHNRNNNNQKPARQYKEHSIHIHITPFHRLFLPDMMAIRPLIVLNKVSIPLLPQNHN